jgi:hypothetical protein
MWGSKLQTVPSTTLRVGCQRQSFEILIVELDTRMNDNKLKLDSKDRPDDWESKVSLQLITQFVNRSYSVTWSE